MKQIELVIQNRTGLHARPAKVLVNLAKQFKSDISLQHGAKRANAKSMVSVLTLGAVSGSLHHRSGQMARMRNKPLLRSKPPSGPGWVTMNPLPDQLQLPQLPLRRRRNPPLVHP